jgi:hypothetical protein
MEKVFFTVIILLLGIEGIYVHKPIFFLDTENDNIEKFKDGNDYPCLVYYAGYIKTVNLEKMKGKNVLTFFYEQYQQKLNPSQRILNNLQDFLYSIKFLNRLMFIKNRILMKIFHIK